MTKVKESTRSAVAAEYDAIRKLAAEFERLEPGAGEGLLQRLLADLVGFRQAELGHLSRFPAFPDRSAA